MPLEPIRHDRPQRLTVRQMDRLVEAVEERTVIGSGEIYAEDTPDGQIVRPTQAVEWVFVVGLESFGAFVASAVRAFFGQQPHWTIGRNSAGRVYRFVRFAPNYTREYFEHYLLRAPAPDELWDLTGAMACRMVGGYLVPDYRFRLVEPPSAADCDLGEA